MARSVSGNCVAPPLLWKITRQLAILLLAVSPCFGMAYAKPCDSDTYEQALLSNKTSLVLDCDMHLRTGDTVAKHLIFEGKTSSGITLDCGGGKLSSLDGNTIVVRSRGKDWREMSVDRPTDITIRNCSIEGSVRIFGLAANGQGALLRESSQRAGHTERAQAAAPTRIHLERISFSSKSRIPLYIAPGVTEVSIESSTFDGTLQHPTIYLDAESARNSIHGNIFRTINKRREVIAIDGSAYNVISGNTFNRLDNGGIFAYRNCGEGGTIRHQAPQHNFISDNRFVPDYPPAAPAVWLGSRNGSLYWRLATRCTLRLKQVLGTREDSDSADLNRVTHNDFVGLPIDRAVRNNGRNNHIADNITDD